MQISIESSQGVEFEYTLSSVLARMGATILDLILFGFYSLVIGALLGATSIAFILPIVNILSFFLYHILMEQFAAGQTLGKKVVGIRVIRLDGRYLSLVDSCLRAFLLLIEGFMTIGTLAILTSGTSKLRQRIGDLAADTVVIDIPNLSKYKFSLLKDLENMKEEDVVYPEVSVFSEQDMLLIKEAIRDYMRYKDELRGQIIKKLAEQSQEKMGIKVEVKDKISFLRQLIMDYVILTR